jgi:hypothetical protein
MVRALGLVSSTSFEWKDDFPEESGSVVCSDAVVNGRDDGARVVIVQRLHAYQVWFWDFHEELLHFLG